VRDQSRNGTFVNGAPIQEAVLAEGSVLRLGSTELAFHEGEQSATLAAPLELGLTQTIVRDTPVTEHDSGSMAAAALVDSPEAQDLWRLHQFSVRLLVRRPQQEIFRDAMQVLQERTEASSVACFTVDHHQQLRLKLAAPEGGLPGPLPSEALTKLVIGQGRALWLANQQQPARAGGTGSAAPEHEADVLYLPLVCAGRVSGALYVYLKQGHFRQSQFEFAIAAANLTSRALARAWEDDRREGDLREAAVELGIDQELIGHSPAIVALREQLTRIAGAGRHVVIHGQRGAGKAFVARWLHEAGAKRAGQAVGPFVVCRCGPTATTEPNGAIDEWSRADGGTLYLAEIGRLPAPLQEWLLQQLAPPGDPGESAVGDLAAQRVIAGTSIDLRALVRRGEFSPELLAALAEHEVDVPSLGQRREDIPALCDHFLSLDRLRSGRPDLGLSQAARERLTRHDWPGNVRQLRLALQLAALTVTGPVIEATDLPLGHGGSDQEWESIRIDDWERRLITLALARAGGNVPEAARLLGIGRATLYRKLEEYGIQR
jgi:Nif-specific regulatory protein